MDIFSFLVDKIHMEVVFWQKNFSKRKNVSEPIEFCYAKIKGYSFDLIKYIKYNI